MPTAEIAHDGPQSVRAINTVGWFTPVTGPPESPVQVFLVIPGFGCRHSSSCALNARPAVRAANEQVEFGADPSRTSRGVQEEGPFGTSLPHPRATYGPIASETVYGACDTAPDNNSSARPIRLGSVDVRIEVTCLRAPPTGPVRHRLNAPTRTSIRFAALPATQWVTVRTTRGDMSAPSQNWVRRRSSVGAAASTRATNPVAGRDAGLAASGMRIGDVEVHEPNSAARAISLSERARGDRRVRARIQTARLAVGCGWLCGVCIGVQCCGRRRSTQRLGLSWLPR